ncbi:hypothetical protein BDV3_002458 [Batrachochytrium dendrobatidis]|uniref:Uncharacterized protein n=1 Tax=Batrachochytrium dendrobatidis (strain JEL423) TaxID=403673 RepID=A0A177WWP9_BATDL|nr:hypothetical protein O5D80_000759 [Batrachochytrium dendrobatidis]KAK5667646.1 hypothetical protein QVD99_005760 [Batrachochytrium dendrobatidis]OAJ44322.1 hypothetical protein BDEG_27566 [Batrachochytrium dendrobatidis JEL423]
MSFVRVPAPVQIQIAPNTSTSYTDQAEGQLWDLHNRQPTIIDLFGLGQIQSCVAFKTCLMGILMLWTGAVFYVLWLLQFEEATMVNDTLSIPVLNNTYLVTNSSHDASHLPYS